MNLNHFLTQLSLAKARTVVHLGTTPAIVEMTILTAKENSAKEPKARVLAAEKVMTVQKPERRMI